MRVGLPGRDDSRRGRAGGDDDAALPLDQRVQHRPDVGGKHVVKMTKPGHRPITLPHDKGGGGYPIGLTVAIMRQAGLKGGAE